MFQHTCRDGAGLGMPLTSLTSRGPSQVRKQNGFKDILIRKTVTQSHIVFNFFIL